MKSVNNIPTIRFRLRKEKSYQFPIIQAYITIYGEEAPKFSTQIRVESGLKWNQVKQQFYNSSQLANANNLLLSEIKAKIIDSYTFLNRTGKTINCRILKAEFMKVWRKNDKRYTLINVFNEFFEEKKTGTLEKKTLDKYVFCRTHLRRFIKSLHNSKDIDIKLVDALFGYRLFEFLCKSMMEPTANRYLQYVKATMEFAIKKGYVTENPLLNTRPKIHHNPTNKTTVSETQQLKILNLDSLTITERHIADITTFMFYTTYDHCDYLEFNKKEHVITLNGEEVIQKRRFKQRKSVNAKVCTISLNDVLKSILVRYENKFPRYPDQTVRKIYKNLCSRVGIENFNRIGLKQIRKSGGTFYLNNDVPLQIVSEGILGHNSTNMTQKYYTKIEENTALLHTRHLNKRQM